MSYFLFGFFVLILGGVLLVSGLYAHMPVRRYTAGWWAGVILALIVIASSQSYFQELPTHIVSSGCSTEKVIDWENVVPLATQINWFVFSLGIILGILAFEVLERIVRIPDKIMGVVLLFISFTSLGLLVYVFLIRRISYIFFSFVMGTFLSWFLHIAFVSRFFGTKSEDKK